MSAGNRPHARFTEKGWHRVALLNVIEQISKRVQMATVVSVYCLSNACLNGAKP